MIKISDLYYTSHVDDAMFLDFSSIELDDPRLKGLDFDQTPIRVKIKSMFSNVHHILIFLEQGVTLVVKNAHHIITNPGCRPLSPCCHRCVHRPPPLYWTFQDRLIHTSCGLQKMPTSLTCALHHLPLIYFYFPISDTSAGLFTKSKSPTTQHNEKTLELLKIFKISSSASLLESLFLIAGTSRDFLLRHSERFYMLEDSNIIVLMLERALDIYRETNNKAKVSAFLKQWIDNRIVHMDSTKITQLINIFKLPHPKTPLQCLFQLSEKPKEYLVSHMNRFHFLNEDNIIASVLERSFDLYEQTKNKEATIAFLDHWIDSRLFYMNSIQKQYSCHKLDHYVKHASE